MRGKRWVRGMLSFLWVKNPILISGLSMVTAVMATKSAWDALCISVALGIMLVPTVAVAFVTPVKLRMEMRFILYTVVASLSYLPAFAAVRAMNASATAALGIYLPLLAVNELIVLRADRFVTKKSAAMTVLDTAGCLVSFTLSMLLIAVLREMFGSGTVFGYPVLSHTLPVLLLPFSGFIIVGFTAAGLRKVQMLTLYALRQNRLKRRKRAERAEKQE